MKILPFNLNPPIKGYLHHELLFGIIFAEYTEDKMKWLASNYIQIYFDTTDIRIKHKLDFYHKHWWGYYEMFTIERLEFDTINSCNIKWLQLIRDKVDNCWYTEIFVDEYYLPDCAVYQQQHYIHTILIIGYNDNAFTYVGYGKNGHYGMVEVEEMYLNLASIKNITMIRLNENAKWEFDYHCAKNFLKDFFESYDTSQRYKYFIKQQPTSCVYGLTALKAYLNEIEIIKKCDTRFVIIIEEHSRVFAHFIQIWPVDLESKDQLLGEMKSIQKAAKKLIALSLKLSICEDMRNLEKIKQNLTFIIHKYEDIKIYFTS